jgi:hypothetical protein
MADRQAAKLLPTTTGSWSGKLIPEALPRTDLPRRVLVFILGGDAR